MITKEDNTPTFDQRKLRLLQNTARVADWADPKTDVYGNSAIAALTLDSQPEQPNAVLRYVAHWFDHPHPTGRDHRGENDFAAMKLCRAYYLFRNSGLLEPQTLEAIQRFFLSFDFESMYGSENHHFLFRTSRFLIASAWPEAIFEAYEKTGRELAVLDADWLDTFIRFRARRGWGEFSSSCYIVPDLECLLSLYDFSPSPTIQHLAGMMLDVRLVDMAVDSLGGMYCGAHGRIYQRDALDHRDESSLPIQYLYFGNMPEDWIDQRSTLVDVLTSGFRPAPIVLEIANERRQPYENRERAHLHNVDDVLPAQPLPGSIAKYTYWTPDYVMGAVVRQDSYPPDCPGRWYMHHEQHEWDFSVAGHPDARIFSHHPGKIGNEHGYWTGDLKCGCGHFLQVKNVLLAVYDIPADEPLQYIHAYFPQSAFDELIESDDLIAARKGDVLVALRFSNGCQWAATGDFQGSEIISQGSRSGVVCEVGLLADYPSLQTFAFQIAANTIHWAPDRVQLSYQSTSAGKLTIDAYGRRERNGEALDLEYPTYGSPYLASAWDSGLIEIKYGDDLLRLDFRKNT
jgi:hypothetical protein